MKKIVYTLVTGLLLAGSLTSCDKRLDDIQPQNSVNSETALLTSSDVEAALVGAYTGLQSVNGYGGGIQLMSDLLGDSGEQTFVGTFQQPNEINQKRILTTNSFVSGIWNNSYIVINRVNNVLANTSKLNTPVKVEKVTGEAKFIRGAMYFELVRLFAKDWSDGTPGSNLGVPLVLTPTVTFDASSQVKRNTVAEVYAQVIADLTDAEAKLKTSSTIFANTNAAAGMLSRVYLQQGNFPAAAAAANRAIGRYTLNPSYIDEFYSDGDVLPNSSEDIFAIQISAQSGINDLNTFFYQRGDISIQDAHLDLYDSDDERAELFSSDGAQTYSDKFSVIYGNLKIMRVAEMYLTRAEANFRAGTEVGAKPVDDINRIRTRVGLDPLESVTLADILLERKLELAFEGFRLGDVKRNKESVLDPGDPDGLTLLPWNSPRLIFPIPQREINVNPNLVQNEGYN